jgi:hypothetical protein
MCFICGGIVEDDALVTDKTLLGLVTDWERFLQAAEDGPMNKLRQATRTGRPAGDGAVVTTVERITGRDLSKGDQGGLESVLCEKQCYVPRFPDSSSGSTKDCLLLIQDLSTRMSSRPAA